MELYGRSSTREGYGLTASAAAGTGLEESMRKLGIWNVPLVYPERVGAPDCAYYMRTGSCSYGAKCRYNHPRDRSTTVGGTLRVGVAEYPERPGETSCQFYLRTGFCKFGASCKFHHPKNGGGFTSNILLNSYGYPLRQGEQECLYYLRTGECKFGITCKFNHPQPAGVSMPAAATARPFYPSVQSSSSSVVSADQYRAARPPLLPGSYVPAGAYGTTTMLLPTGSVVSIPGWNPYSGSANPVFSPSSGQPSIYGNAQISSSSSSLSAFPGIYSEKEKVFPERPGQPDCQYYLQTGDCKCGSSCRYHHPPDWALRKTTCVLNYLGLPLRPGLQACTFYMQRGSCKFGRNCKFDHPIGSVVRYNNSPPTIPSF
ncbi:zinc finger CCCH domain-containing protein 32-like [Impatiens glandulifera]|uniref:zinc finger CCCH domain-containing protein 32-like n=1 Tax=Impatiens glandulifera TaxID=253017 RepID=UPI001FB19331|nr:zinc finger CCCH domain-containing protein 32-like [Impatiens glandulifera]